MWCSFPAPSGPGESFEIPDRGRSVMYLTGKERGWIMLYEKLPQPTRERRTYTDEDVAAFAARFADYPVNAQLHVRDVFARRLTWGMSDLGEGVAGRWSGAGGRIVLVGDACHKFTPNAGLGLNNAIQDVVVLSNGLWRALREAENSDGPSGNRLDGETLSEVFRRYHAARQEPLQKDYGRSALVTRLQAWATPLHYVLSRFVFSFAFVAKLVTRFAVSPLLSRGLVLDYVPSSDLPAGKVPWEHRMPSSSSQ
ncbi:hypothetical protein VTK73DRAFT_1676 [Phialemonium thermophilum]|uniref:FAD-binding domain-containing protein n=1 Tax=Phialemonium thermophilum TaxID=223376 RepID=A0ABR3VT76_9PEZI